MKKLKHLKTTMLQYADETNKSSKNKWPETILQDYNYVGNLEQRLHESGYLVAKDMKKCNKLYDKYKVVYEK